jgi:hypothetical protein
MPEDLGIAAYKEGFLKVANPQAEQTVEQILPKAGYKVIMLTVHSPNPGTCTSI